ncbi:hypothetical protein [Aestuariivivens sediminicola]|uniref:hypothetical protein n=1 Tax=Aestuariivivens sediminicola TaxID=2913560 RepID=UPI001F57A0EC|nr:hypothetical protein [Aestuariivivens sediminicola]
MNSQILLYFFCSLITCHVFAQNEYEYMGGIVLNDTLTITYRLHLKENNGAISGFSISDIGGTYETKSTVFGEYDDINKELSFRETQTVYTKTPLEPDYEFCYINTTLKNFTLGRTKDAKVKFIGLFSDNTRCIDGELFISSVDIIESRMTRVTKKINRMKKVPDSIKQRFKPLKMMDSLNMNILRKEQTLSVFSKSNQVHLIIYDGGKEDGDKITVSANSKTLLKNYEAKKEKRSIVLDVSDDTTSITIEAVNEGTIAPNTVIVEIKDGHNNIQALSNLKAGEKTQIDILKVRN